ncbi:MAG TPA: SRPBCC family protein [Gaiellaceae bacterium]|jgi:uncharacterized protein YndB with AHSA1/START domain|nr:SRPBCC family protein [Gaiellaceae bacterium]
MSRVEASGVLSSPRADVWALVSEPYHLPDWWPGYTGVRPDRRGLAEDARWEVVRGKAPGLLRRPEGEGLVVVTRVVDGYELRWHDVRQGLEAGVLLDNAGTGKTRATTFVSGPWLRLLAEGARSLPERALTRLRDLCQTAASL